MESTQDNMHEIIKIGQKKGLILAEMFDGQQKDFGNSIESLYM